MEGVQGRVKMRGTDKFTLMEGVCDRRQSEVERDKGQCTVTEGVCERGHRAG